MSVFVTNSAQVVIDNGFDLTYARIGYENPARTGTLSASTAAAGFPAASAQNDNTWERWKPTALPATWRIDMGAARFIDYFGIAAHDLKASGCTVRAQYSTDDAAWSNASDIATPLTEEAIMLLFPKVSARYWRLLVAGAAVMPSIGVIFMGSVLTMMRPIYRGITPLGLGRSAVIRPQSSERGQFLGRSVIRSGLVFEANWQNLTPAWYRATFDPFVLAARANALFLAWRPGTFADDVAYGWTDGDITPTISGPKSFMSVGLKMLGAHGL